MVSATIDAEERAGGLFKIRCPAFVRGAARMVSKLADAEPA